MISLALNPPVRGACLTPYYHLEYRITVVLNSLTSSALLSASGWPRELLAADDVDVQVVDALASLNAVVDDDPEPLVQLLLLRIG